MSYHRIWFLVFLIGELCSQGWDFHFSPNYWYRAWYLFICFLNDLKMTFSETSTELFQSFKLDNLFYILVSMSLFYFLAPSFLNCRLQPHMRSYNGWNVGVENHLSTVQFFWMCNKQNLILSQILTNPRCFWQHLPMLLASSNFTVLFWTYNMHTALWMQLYHTGPMNIAWMKEMQTEDHCYELQYLQTVHTNFSPLTETRWFNYGKPDLLYYCHSSSYKIKWVYF